MGDYKLTVQSRNLLGTASTTQEFSVNSAVPPPSTRLDALPQTSGSNAIPLSWVVEDGAEDIERFEMQYRPGNEEWENYPEEISGNGAQPAAVEAGRGVRVPPTRSEQRWGSRKIQR